MTQHQIVTSIRPEPSPYKEKLKRKGFTAGAVAQHVGLSYPYVLNMLNGAHPMTEHTEMKIQELLKIVEDK